MQAERIKKGKIMNRLLFKTYDNDDKRWLMNGNAIDLKYCIESGLLLFDNDLFSQIHIWYKGEKE